MTDERDNRASDRLVSDTYREVANERAPQVLNDKVLRMAAGAKPARSLIPGPWMKPVAWAATIGLSLAIVLELTQVPQTPADIDGLSPASMPEEPAMQTPARIETSPDIRIDERQDRQLQTEKSNFAEPLTATDSQDSMKALRDVKPEVHRAKVTVTEEAARAMASAPALPEAAGTAADEAENDADNAVGQVRNATALPSMTAPAAKMRMAEPFLCPASARESADDWYRCIESKRAVSPAEAIDREIDALREQFPDFPIPGANK